MEIHQIVGSLLAVVGSPHIMLLIIIAVPVGMFFGAIPGPRWQAWNRASDSVRLRHGPVGGCGVPARHARRRPHRRLDSLDPVRRSRHRSRCGDHCRRLPHGQTWRSRTRPWSKPRRLRVRRRCRRSFSRRAAAGSATGRPRLQPVRILPARHPRHHFHRHPFGRQPAQRCPGRHVRSDAVVCLARPVYGFAAIHLRPALPVGRHRRHRRGDGPVRHPGDDLTRRQGRSDRQHRYAM